MNERLRGPGGLPVLVLDSVRRTYAQGRGELHVFSDARLTIQPGEIVALVGPSGAGKSSLLHIAGLLEAPSEGEIFISGTPVSGMEDGARTAMRRETLGFVYQFHHLLPEFTALENVAMPLIIAGWSGREAEARARALLERMGLTARAGHRPAQLSGGEQQRVAIARALANHPRLLLADEPTGNLDPQTAARVFEVMIEAVRSEGLSALIATHNLDLAARMDRVFVMKDGRLVEAERPQRG